MSDTKVVLLQLIILQFLSSLFSAMQILAQILPFWFAQIKKDLPGGNCSFIAHGYNWEKISENRNAISKCSPLLFVGIYEWFNYFSINMQIFLIKDFYQL